mmetsp:Transcript_51632/g.109714  ORF Transcript_51632/g.109714 Transcript_51632/m.109714 type:complete len:85 (+) Transcript_51632:1238-1492(+)
MVSAVSFGILAVHSKGMLCLSFGHFCVPACLPVSLPSEIVVAPTYYCQSVMTLLSQHSVWAQRTFWAGRPCRPELSPRWMARQH